jgi:hypothetical protein
LKRRQLSMSFQLRNQVLDPGVPDGITHPAARLSEFR